MYQLSAQPSAEATYMKPTIFRLSPEPNRAPGNPAKRAPMNVPNNALATEKPYQNPPGAMWNTWLSDWVTPEITTVSKPNSKPARLAVRMTPKFLEPICTPARPIYIRERVY